LTSYDTDHGTRRSERQTAANAPPEEGEMKADKGQINQSWDFAGFHHSLFNASDLLRHPQNFQFFSQI
jgi:hypothetical protein